MKQEPFYVGIDVSKSRLDVGVRPGGDGWSVAYYEAGVRDFGIPIAAPGTSRCAAGGLEVPLVASLTAAALPVVLVNPRRWAILLKPPAGWLRPMPWMRR